MKISQKDIDRVVYGCETTRLIGVGVCKNILVSDLSVGMKVMFNYGSVSTVTDIRVVTPKTVEIFYDGGGSQKRRLTSRIVGFYGSANTILARPRSGLHSV